MITENCLVCQKKGIKRKPNAKDWKCRFCGSVYHKDTGLDYQKANQKALKIDKYQK